MRCPCQQEEMKAQLPRYQRLAPRPGQAHVAAPPVAAVGGIMPPQQGLPPQQPGMRHPIHGKKILLFFFLAVYRIVSVLANSFFV